MGKETMYRKIKTASNEVYLLAFNLGDIKHPILLLNECDIDRINNEWKKNVS